MYTTASVPGACIALPGEKIRWGLATHVMSVLLPYAHVYNLCVWRKQLWVDP